MSAACGNLITEGIEVLCTNNSGGVLRILVTDYCNLVQAGLTEPTDGMYTAIEVATGERFYEVNTQRLTASIEENEENNIDNGSKKIMQILNIVVAKRDVDRRNTIKSLGAGQKQLSFAVQDSNKIWWGVGFREGVQLLTNTSGSGTKKEDLNGYTIQFYGDASEYMSKIDDGLIDALLLPAP